MTPHAYLVNDLASQMMPQSALDNLQRIRSEIGFMRGLTACPRMIAPPVGPA